MRKVTSILLTTLIFSYCVAAQDNPKAEVFGGYSFERITPCGKSGGGCGFENNEGPLTTNYNGWNASVTGYFRRSLGVTADFAGYYGTSKFAQGGGSASSTAYSYMFGPVYAYRMKGATPFVHALVGGISRGNSPFGLIDYHALVWAFGGGLDLDSSSHLAIRVAQFDFLENQVPKGAASPAAGFRYSGGIVFKF